MRDSKTSSVHNYYIVPFRTGVQPDVLYFSTGQPSPKPLTSQSFSICQQTVFAFFALVSFDCLCYPNERTNVRMLFSPFFCIQISMEIPLSARGWFPNTALLQPFPQRRCFFSTSSHKRHWDEEFQLFPFTAIKLFSISLMDLFHYPQG